MKQLKVSYYPNLTDLTVDTFFILTLALLRSEMKKYDITSDQIINIATRISSNMERSSERYRKRIYDEDSKTIKVPT